MELKDKKKAYTFPLFGLTLVYKNVHDQSHRNLRRGTLAPKLLISKIFYVLGYLYGCLEGPENQNSGIRSGKKRD